jgi:hypothetical protein
LLPLEFVEDSVERFTFRNGPFHFRHRFAEA